MRKTAAWIIAGLALMAPTFVDDATIIDFDDRSATGAQLEPDAYLSAGVRFPAVAMLAYETGMPSSGTNAIQVCYGAELCAMPFRFEFVAPQTSVSANLGFAYDLSAAASVVMLGFDVAGQVVGLDQVDLTPPGPVGASEHVLRIEDPHGRIRDVEIRWSDPERFTDGLVVDDLAFEPFVPTFELQAEPGRIYIENAPIGQPTWTTLTLQNTGNTAVAIDAELVPADGAFGVTEWGCPTLLEPGAICDVTVEFRPEEGRHDARLRFYSPTSSNPDTLVVIPLSGETAAAGPETTASTFSSTTSQATTTSTPPTSTSLSSTTTEAAALAPGASTTTSVVVETTDATAAVPEVTAAQVPAPPSRPPPSGAGGPLFVTAVLAASGGYLIRRRHRPANERVTSVRLLTFGSETHRATDRELAVGAFIDLSNATHTIREEGAT